MSQTKDQNSKTKSAKIAAGSARSFSARKSVFLLAYTAQVWEQLWPRLVPLFILACIFTSLAWFGAWQIAPDWVRWAAIILFAALALGAILPLRNFEFPTQAQIFRRIEKASGFEHRPVTAQMDAPANPDDPYAGALWAEHKRRMAKELDDLAAGTARPNGNLFDRYALRAILPLLAFIALGFSYSPHGGRLGDILEPRINTSLILSRLDMWVSPPGYTGKPPLYFAAPLQPPKDQAPTVEITALEGSELSISYVGDDEISARLRSNANIETLEPEIDDTGAPAEMSRNYSALLGKPNTVEILLRDELFASWQINIEQDQIPEIILDKPPSSALSGALELNYTVKDDYGVIAAKGFITKIETANTGARPLVEAPQFDLPLPRARAKSGSSKVNRDLSSHPWAGSKVVLTLQAQDDPGQIGRTQPITITLPGRTFIDPMAKALVEQRRLLAFDANSAPYVANLLDAVTTHPEIFEIDMKAYVALQSAYRMIVPANNDDKLREAMEVLWETALAIELGDLSEVERKLREAQEKLAKALEKGASDEEIDELMEELRQAMADFLKQMAREMAKNPIKNNPLANRQNSQTLSERDLEKMMKRIEDLAKSGSKDAARELLAEMQRMMDNLSAGRHQQQRQAEGNELNQALDKLSELMQEQQRLMDETFSMQRRQPQQNGQQQGQNGEQSQNGQSPNQENEQNADGSQNGSQEAPQNGPMTPEEFAEAMKQLQQQQKALEERLAELGQQLDDLGLDPSEGFGEAGEEMSEAGRNLGKGKTGDAAGNQGQALQALRKGAQSMMEQMAGDRNQGGQQQGQSGQNGKQQQNSDPLGRRSGQQARGDNNGTKIPGEIDAQRAREIMEAIRERLSNPLRPLIERNYLERLLENR